MKVREVALRDVGRSDTPDRLGKYIGREGDKAWNDCFDAVMRRFGDAEVIGLPCPTCGGKRFIAKPSGDLPDAGSTFTPCPDCAEAPVYVIAPEAMEAAAKVLGEAFFGTHWERMSEAHRDEARAKTRTILEAAGIVVADEVVNAALEEEAPREQGCAGSAP